MPLNKKELRGELMLRRRLLDKSTKQKYDDLIHTKLVELIGSEAPENILCYVSTDTEVGTIRFICEMLSAGKAIYAPRCEGRNMRFLRVNDLSELKKSAYGILEPVGTEELLDFIGTVCVVPALSYDREGYRLGYGGGYYDRFLKDYSGLSAGICYREFLGAVPREEFDLPVKLIITEEEIINCGGKE